MVTGPLATLNDLWKAYGVSISVQRKTGLEAHSDVMDFIDAQGDLRDQATPFADESAAGLTACPRPASPGGARESQPMPERLVDAVSDPSPPPHAGPRSGSATADCLSRLAVAVIVLITVLTDLPVSTSRASDIGAERSVMSEVNTDLAPCAYAIRQAIRHLESPGGASAHAGRTGSDARACSSDDQSACSFTNEDIFDLANIQVAATTGGQVAGSDWWRPRRSGRPLMRCGRSRTCRHS